MSAEETKAKKPKRARKRKPEPEPEPPPEPKVRDYLCLDCGCVVEGSITEEEAELAAGDEEATKAGALFGGDAGAAINRPPWLVKGPPSTSKKRWPGGARSASWLKRLRKCPRNHSQRYRHRKPDPTNFPGHVGNVLHDVLDWACKRRLRRSFRGLGAVASVDEMLHLAEFHAAARKDPEVLERVREIIHTMGPVDFSRAWRSELLVQYRVTHAFHLAGYIDLVEVVGDEAAPEEVIATDYKSGATVLTDDEMFRDEQVGLYLVALRHLFPNARRVTFRMWYLSLGVQKKTPYSKFLEREFLARARSGVNTWHANDETARPEEGNCNHCPYRNDCVALSTAITRSKMLPVAGSIEAWSLEEKMRRYRESKVAEKNAIVRREDLAELILKEMGPRQNSYRAGRLLASKVRRSVTHWDSSGEALVEIAKAVDIPLSSIVDQLGKGIGSKKIKVWIASLGDGYREAVERIVERRCKTTVGAAHVQITERKTVGEGKAKMRLPF